MKRLQLKNNIGLLCLSLLLLWVSPLGAQTITIRSAGDGPWGNTGTWSVVNTGSPARFPNATDYVSIESGHAIRFSVARECARLKMSTANDTFLDFNSGAQLALVSTDGWKFRMSTTQDKDNNRFDLEYLSSGYTNPAGQLLQKVVRYTVHSGHTSNQYTMQFETTLSDVLFDATWKLYTSTNGITWTELPSTMADSGKTLKYSSEQTLGSGTVYYGIAIPSKQSTAGCMSMTAYASSVQNVTLTYQGVTTPEESVKPAGFSVQEGLQWRVQTDRVLSRLVLESSDIYNRINPQSVLVVKGASGWTVVPGTTVSNGTISINNYTVPNNDAIFALAQVHSSLATPRRYDYPQLNETVRVQTDGEWTTVANTVQDAYSSAGGEYIVTPAENDRKTVVWRNEAIDLNRSFEMGFEVYFGTKDATGADGIAMLWQGMRDCSGLLRKDVLGWGSSGVTSSFGTGEFLGTLFVRPSLIFEFDTWQNNTDPSEDHMAIAKNGNITNTGLASGRSNVIPLTGNTTTSPVVNIEDGAWYLINMYWDWPDANRTSASLRMDLIRKATPTEPERYLGAVNRTFTAAEVDQIFGVQYNSNPSAYTTTEQVANAEWDGTSTQKWANTSWTGGDRRVVVGFSASTGGSNNLQKFKELRVSYTSLRLDLDTRISGLDYNTYLAPNVEAPIVNSAATVGLTSAGYKLTELEIRIMATDGLDKESLSMTGTLPNTLLWSYDQASGLGRLYTKPNMTASEQDYKDALALVRYKTATDTPVPSTHRLALILKGEINTAKVTSQTATVYLRPMRVDLDGTDGDVRTSFSKLLSSVSATNTTEVARSSNVILDNGLTADKIRIDLSGLKPGDVLKNSAGVILTPNISNTQIVEINLTDATTSQADASNLQAFSDYLNGLRLSLNNTDYLNRNLKVSLVGYATQDPSRSFESVLSSSDIYTAGLLLNDPNINYSNTITAKGANIALGNAVKVIYPGTLKALTISIRTPYDTEELVIGTPISTKITATLSTDKRTVVLTPTSGQSPVASDYEAAVKQIFYRNNTDLPVLATRYVDASFTFQLTGNVSTYSSGNSVATLALGYGIPRIHRTVGSQIIYNYTRNLDVSEPATKTILQGSAPTFSFWAGSDATTVGIYNGVATEISVSSLTLRFPSSQIYLLNELRYGIGDSYGGKALVYTEVVSNNMMNLNIRYSDNTPISPQAFRNMLKLQLARTELDANAKTYLDRPRVLDILAYDGSQISNAFTYTFANLNTQVLPLQIAYWKSKVDGRAVNLQWQLLNTQHLLACALERSVDGLTYVQIANLPLQADYNFRDMVSVGNYQYRLRLELKGGKVMYSQPISAQVSQQATGLQLWPNPVQEGLLFYRYAGSAHTEIHVQLIDMQGKLILQEQLRIPAEGELIQVLHVRTKGAYLLRVQSPGQQAEVKKVLVQ